MHFMERRGSGFKKIKSSYHQSANYRSEVEPLFKSTPTSFFVTLYNLNYNVPIESVLIAPEKVAIDEKNIAIELAIEELNASQNTIRKAAAVYEKMGIDSIFGRSDIVAITNDSVTAAGNLINKLKNAKLIEAVSGYGKGKYKFIRPKE